MRRRDRERQEDRGRKMLMRGRGDDGGDKERMEG